MKVNKFHYFKCNFPGINRLWATVCQVSNHFFASVRLSQVCIPYSAQLTCYSFVITWISRLFENIYELDHFVLMVTSVFVENRYVGCWTRKYKRFDEVHESSLLSYVSNVIKRFIQLAKVIIGVIFLPRFIYFELLYTNFSVGVFHITIWSAAQLLRRTNH